MVMGFFLYSQIELIDRVDDIYRNTTWDNEFKGYGVQIHQVDVCVCLCGWMSVVFHCRMVQF